MGGDGFDSKAFFTWAQDVAGSVINKATDAAYVQPYELSRLRLQALGDDGYYTEGQRGATQAPKAGFTVSPQLMLIGAAVLAVVLLKD